MNGSRTVHGIVTRDKQSRKEYDEEIDNDTKHRSCAPAVEATTYHTKLLALCCQVTISRTEVQKIVERVDFFYY